MICNICDKTLSEKEIQYNDELHNWEPCSICMEVIMDAAYSGKFAYDEEEGDIVVLDVEFDETLDDSYPFRDDLGYADYD